MARAKKQEKTLAKAGKPRIIESPEELFRLFLNYIQDCISKDRFANTAGFRRHIYLKKSTYYDYEHREEYSDTIKKMDDILEDETWNAKMPPAEKIFYLKNKFGYRDKTEVDNTHTFTNKLEDYIK